MKLQRAPDGRAIKSPPCRRCTVARRSNRFRFQMQRESSRPKFQRHRQVVVEHGGRHSPPAVRHRWRETPGRMYLQPPRREPAASDKTTCIALRFATQLHGPESQANTYQFGTCLEMACLRPQSIAFDLANLPDFWGSSEQLLRAAACPRPHPKL